MYQLIQGDGHYLIVRETMGRVAKVFSIKVGDEKHAFEILRALNEPRWTDEA